MSEHAEIKVNTCNITLVSRSNTRYVINKHYASISNIIKEAIELDPTATEIELMAIDDTTMQQIVQYMEHHAGKEPPTIPKPIKSTNMTDLCSDKWDALFITAIDPEQLNKLGTSAYYIDINGLTHLYCARIAALMRTITG